MEEKKKKKNPMTSLHFHNKDKIKLHNFSAAQDLLTNN